MFIVLYESGFVVVLNYFSTNKSTLFILRWQRTVESYIEKRIGSTYGPPGGRRMTVFVDDINMPIVNEWGDQVGHNAIKQERKVL